MAEWSKLGQHVPQGNFSSMTGPQSESMATITAAGPATISGSNALNSVKLPTQPASTSAAVFSDTPSSVAASGVQINALKEHFQAGEPGRRLTKQEMQKVCATFQDDCGPWPCA